MRWIQEKLPGTGQNSAEVYIMRGSPKNQVNFIFRESGLNLIGQSKHEEKEIVRQNGAKTWHEMGQKMGIHSYNTADAYRECWVRCFEYNRRENGLKDLTKIEPQHVENYLNYCVDSGVSRATYNQYSAALGKLNVALNRFSENKKLGRSYDLTKGIEATRKRAQESLAKFDGSRAYERPCDLICEIKDEKFHLAAEIQHNTGCRLHETALILPKQLDGDNFTYVGKGGKILTKELPSNLADSLRQQFRESGEFRIDKNKYRVALKSAAFATGQSYTGSHGLRWSYAQEKMQEFGKKGQDFYTNLGEVSKLMGHERPDITEYYLK